VSSGLVADVVHKTELGWCAWACRRTTTCRSRERHARARAQARQGAPRLLVQEQVRPVAELIVGGRVDPVFGPVVVVGGGGVLVELFKDVAIRLAPVGEAEARAMLGETRASALLRGFRGRPVADTDAAARTVSALSRIVADFRERLAGSRSTHSASWRAGGALDTPSSSS
jgi:hypothetical protein